MRFAPVLVSGLAPALAAALTVPMLACGNEVETCRQQLDETLAEFYKGDAAALQVEHFAAFDRLPQHNAPACVTEVLHDASMDAAKIKQFELIAPLWRGARADILASEEPDIDPEGMIRVNASEEFYARACSMGHELSCERADLVKQVVACGRNKASGCLGAAEGLGPDTPFAQAFPSPVTLLAKACFHGSDAGCTALQTHPKRDDLNRKFREKLCAHKSLVWCPAADAP